MDKRVADVNVRLTEKELDYLKNRSELSGFRFKNGRGNFSGYLRSLLFAASGYRDDAYMKQLRGLQYELRKIGTNVNQIAKKINSGYIGSSEDLNELKDYLARIESAFRELEEKGGKNGSYETDAHEGEQGQPAHSPEKRN